MVEPVKQSVYFLFVDENHVNQRIDNYLISRLKGLPKSRLYQLLRRGEIRVNKKRIKAYYRLQVKDAIRIPPLYLGGMPKKLPHYESVSWLIPLILYEDNDFVVINKPSGLAVHGGSQVNFSLLQALKALYRDQNFYLVHRLDRETSGCLMLAKQRHVLLSLQKLFINRKIVKDYLAFVKGSWVGLTALTANFPLYVKHFKNGDRRVIVDDSLGKEAITTFTCLEQCKEGSLLKASLKTGRMHQIRVHAKHLGHPILGDKKYGDFTFNRKLICKRLLLHAHTLAFKNPLTGKYFSVRAPLDIDAYNFLKKRGLCLKNIHS